jgi:hypothetical protein
MLRVPDSCRRDPHLFCPRNKQFQCLHRLDLSEPISSIDHKHACGLLVDSNLSLGVDKPPLNPLKVDVEP